MGLIDWLFSSPDQNAGDPQVQTGVERLIQTIDPRLKALSGAPAQLAPAVATALDFCRRTVAALPGPLDASAEHWRSAPLLRALFTRADEVQQIFSRQAVVQEFVQQHPEVQTFHAILGAVLQEKKGFGVALNGDALQHDVAVTTLNFERHRLYLPQSSPEALDQALVWALFDQLGLEILTRLSAMKEDQADLQEEIALLRTQLAHLEHRGIGDIFCGESSTAPVEDCTQLAARLEERIKARQAALSQSRQRLLTLDDTLAWVAERLGAPDELVEVDSLDYRVDSVNQLVGPGQSGEDLHLCHFRFTAPHPRQGVILRVSYPVMELLPKNILTREIERLYG